MQCKHRITIKKNVWSVNLSPVFPFNYAYKLSTRTLGENSLNYAKDENKCIIQKFVKPRNTLVDVNFLNAPSKKYAR